MRAVVGFKRDGMPVVRHGDRLVSFPSPEHLDGFLVRQGYAGLVTEGGLEVSSRDAFLPRKGCPSTVEGGMVEEWKGRRG